ncbi:hypothetical protein [Roseateles amylovorans]|uniref:WG repeat-containing protein n=1 Tax=Roseateles amylovorans TaxID=2978473 RepID=A0ABY6B760_9BURK|nr:hypothetical protein [Roseateles amylovorans]UXH79791.1 hypothetical protein N4261_07835 [Roseateles amylovorans]
MKKFMFVVLFAVSGIFGCSHSGSDLRAKRAIELMAERCAKAGERIYRTVEGVEGVVLLKQRIKVVDFVDQYALNDPYGRDAFGDGYIHSFLRGNVGPYWVARPGWPQRQGYRFVEALDVESGKWYRYTGQVEVKQGSSYPLKPQDWKFDVFKVPINWPTGKYGVAYEDISTKEERDLWIAGSRLYVIDIASGEILGERVGYMVDLSQGSLAMGRQPWLYAANNACPSFDRFPGAKGERRGSSMQIRQTSDFVEKILIPVVD